MAGTYLEKLLPELEKAMKNFAHKCSAVARLYRTLLNAWSFKTTPGRKATVLKVLPAAIMWSLWKETNMRAFQNITKTQEGIIDSIKWTVAYWLHDKGPFKNVSMDHFVIRWKEVIFHRP
ncbi:uncharacterized protein LOC113293634 [Papaver somniferum]|uniref:uncharacterized protein LOC113293634 n=1 Tax=Papaver somniferum TaxID=3469 RepID=UPI000E705DBB|nr:uncharacterized protein LOC113293634 [Papaver somniferum]